MQNSILRKFTSFLEKNITLFLISIVILLPILNLDYIFYGFFDQFGIPLPSTVFNFLIYPFLILIVFIFKEKNKKSLFIGLAIYGIIAGIYFILHNQYGLSNFEQLYLSNRYKYSMFSELQYVLKLIIPFGMIYAFFNSDITKDNINKIAIILSLLIAVPIFVSNVFVFSPSTYYDGPTTANFISWFTNGYDLYNPKQLTSLFFFSEGNTTGIILFAIYPILIKQLFIDKKNRLFLSILVFVHGLAMYILATRVATYGVVMMLGLVLVVYILLVLLKKEVFSLTPVLTVFVFITVFYLALPYTPAVKNLAIDNRNDQAVFDDEYLRLEWKDNIDDTDLIPGSAQYNFYYQHIFEESSFLLTIPDIYWQWYYPYRMDPKFYVDLIYDYSFYERQSGRQFEQIFFNYKWNNLTASQKMLGFSYSRFMNGSILLEQDFKMQIFTMGYVGFALFVLPWLLISVFIVLMSLKNFKRLFNFNYLIVTLTCFSFIGGAYLSGHVLDQFLTSILLAFFGGMVLKNILNEEF